MTFLKNLLPLSVPTSPCSVGLTPSRPSLRITQWRRLHLLRLPAPQSSTPMADLVVAFCLQIAYLPPMLPKPSWSV